MDALRALQAALPPEEFWSPKVLGQAPEAVVDAFLDEMVVRKPAQRQRLAQARELRCLPTTERIMEMAQVLKGVPVSDPLHQGISWAAGLPSGVIGRFRPEGGAMALVGSLTWLPEGLILQKLDSSRAPLEALPADLKVRELKIRRCRSIRALPDEMEADFIDATGTGLESLPAGMKVKGSLIVSWCPNLRSLPEGIEAGYLEAYGSGLESLPEKLSVGVLDITSCKALKRLPEGLTLEEIIAEGSGLESLPARLNLLRLTIRNCPITTLPADLRVEHLLDLADTPLASLDDAQIRAMAPGVTGRIAR